MGRLLRDEDALSPLLEILDTGCDGVPRWLVADVRTSSEAAALARRAAADATERGLVPIPIDVYRRLRHEPHDDLRDRTLLLIGDARGDAALAAAALSRAAASSPRPHVLLTFRTERSAGQGCIVREARSAYSATARPRPVAPIPSSDVIGHLRRAERATEFVRAGRHAAAERLLRDVACALARRDAWSAAARTLVRLARLLLERGRPADADLVCEEAAALGERRPLDATPDARLWQAVTRIELDKLTEAESICRAVLLRGDLDHGRMIWARTTLARVLVCQERLSEALTLDLNGREERGVDDVTDATIDAIRIDLLVRIGDLFAAGRLAQRLIDHVDAQEDPVAKVVGHTALLSVRSASGDLLAAEQCLQTISRLAREARVPLRLVRARMIWYQALTRAGDGGRSTGERQYLSRVRGVATPLLARHIAALIEIPAQADVSRTVASAGPVCRGGAPQLLTLIRLLTDEDDARRALRRSIEWIAGAVRPTRIEILSSDAGPVTTIMSAGSGLTTQVGPRVLEAGIVVAERAQGGSEVGVPLRLGSRLLGACVCRWPLDREPPAGATDVLQLAAALIAPLLDVWLLETRSAARASTEVPELLGGSQGIADLRRAVLRAAAAPFAVLIEGESGAGKELVARAIHQLSPRRERRFCDLNCAALPEELLEAELFGHTRGAFTGAVTDRAGLFEEASGGTVFLDELADLSRRGQAKLLRVLQQHEVRRIGESFSRPVDVRIVTATNRDMRRETHDGRFRQDLLYRLDVIRIAIPPLRERPEDVPLLAQHFWRASAARVGTAATLTHAVLAALSRYHWPGNVRELQNVMAALAVAAPGRGRVRAGLLPAAIANGSTPSTLRLDAARRNFERRWVEAALARAAGNRSHAAAALGLSRQGLLKTMARLGMEVRLKPDTPSGPEDTSSDPCNVPEEREE